MIPPTITSVADIRDRWIRPIQRVTGEPAARLICFAHAGGSARSFRPWRGAFPANTEILAIQLPGREERAKESCLVSVDQGAAMLGEMLAPLLRAGTAFFGHSLGGLIAFETVRWLQKHKKIAPTHLFVSACQAPMLALEKIIHREPDAVLIDEVLAYGGTPPEVFEHPELREAILPVLRDDYRLRETYRYRPDEKLRCPVTVCYGRLDTSIDSQKLARWEETGLGPFCCKSFSGGHFYLVEEMSDLARFIREQLRTGLIPPDR